MEQQPWTLIIKYYSEEISTEDRQILFSWVRENKKNKLHFEKAIQLLKTTEKSFETFDPNTPEQWKKFKAKIDSDKNTTLPVPLWRKQWVKIAASILLLIGLGYFFNQPRDNTIEITAIDHIKIAHLPDGSTVTLNVNSSIIYMNSFKEVERKITLIGEGYFEVTEDSNHPFIVYAGNTETKVLGTAFNLKAYEENEIELTVTKGKVKFSASEVDLFLLKGDKINYNAKNKTHTKSRSNDLDLKWIIHDVKNIEKKVEKAVNKTLKQLKKEVNKKRKTIKKKKL